MEIPRYFYYASNVVVGVLLVRRLFDAGEQIIKVLVGYWEFL